MEPCRFGTGCWRPLCPFGHSGRGRAARWAALWSLLAKQEAEDDLELVKVIRVVAGSERFVEQNADVPVSPVVAEVEVIPEEHISERMQLVDVQRQFRYPHSHRSLSLRLCERRGKPRWRSSGRSSRLPCTPHFRRYSTSTRLLPPCLL